MLVGHVAAGFAGRQLAPRIPLAGWMLSVLLVDLVWPVFLLLGFERVRVAPGATDFTPLDFVSYPWTHSLVAGVAWGALLGGIWRLRGTPAGPAALLGAGVVSHWGLDAIVHRPDLPIYPGGPVVGLGLWQSVPATLLLELSLLCAGVWLYARAHRDAARRTPFRLFVALLVVTYLAAAFGPPPPDAETVAYSAMGLWLVVAAAAWVDRDERAGGTARTVRSRDPG